MNQKLKYLFTLFIFSIHLFAFESIEVLNPNITLHKSGYFTTNKILSPQQALEVVNTNNLQSFPKNAYSLGLTTDTTWFVFEVSTKGDEKLYLDSKDIRIGTSYDLFVFRNGLLIKSFHNGHIVPIEQRDIKTQQIRFGLEKNSQNITYLIRAKSKVPLMPIFSFGTLDEIDATWENLYNIMLISYFIGISFLIYNMILYLFTKDKIFIHYCIYIFGVLIICLSGRSYLPFGMMLDPQILKVLLIIALTITGIGLALFTGSFLGLQERLPKSAKILNIISIVFGIMSLAYFLFDMMIVKLLFLASFSFLSFYTLYVGFKIYKNGYIVGLHFLFSTGAGGVLMSLYMFTFYTTNIMPLAIWSITLVNQGLIWDVIALSLALAYRIKLLQEEKNKNEQMLLLQSRQVAIGEFASNVAHQWRQPLTHLSALIATLKVELMFHREVKSQKLEEFINSSNKTVEYLSSTIDVFQGFFTSNEEQKSFSIANELQRTLDFVEDSFQSYQIKIQLNIIKDAMIEGDANTFSQAILNILSNAKDALNKTDQFEKLVILSLDAKKNFIIITIEDNGGGIQIKPIENIFEPYVTSKGLNGVGIGLFIVKNIIEQKFSGNINVYNNKNGACFEIRMSKS